MPLYKFQCSNCTTKFEELVSSDSEKVQCPQCHSDEHVFKLISLVSSVGLTSGCSSCETSSCSSKSQFT